MPVFVNPLRSFFFNNYRNFFSIQALENELSNHQFRIDTVLASGQDLIDSNHYAADEIEERCEELNESWELLMKAAAERKQRLSDALESQKVNKYVLLYSWQRRWARQTVSCVLIGYLNGQHGPILPARDCPL